MTKKQEQLLKWLESYPSGRYIEIFGGSNPTNDDHVAATRFAEGMRKNIGSSGIATVDLSYNRVITQLVLVPVYK